MITGRCIRSGRDIKSLPTIGRVKIGKKIVDPKTGKERAISLDHFIATGTYANLFTKQFEKAKSIPIVFVSDDVLWVCPERYELRNKKGDLFAYGDGAKYMVWIQSKSEYQQFELTEEQKNKLVVSAESSKGWERVLTLRFVIPQIRGIMGVWQFTTKADKGSINSIIDTFDFIQGTAGSIQRVLFDLTVEKVLSQKPEDKSSYPIIRLIPNMSDENILKLGEFMQHGGSVRGIPILTDGVVEDLVQRKLIELTNNQTKES